MKQISFRDEKISTEKLITARKITLENLEKFDYSDETENAFKELLLEIKELNIKILRYNACTNDDEAKIELITFSDVADIYINDKDFKNGKLLELFNFFDTSLKINSEKISNILKRTEGGPQKFYVLKCYLLTHKLAQVKTFEEFRASFNVYHAIFKYSKAEDLLKGLDELVFRLSYDNEATYLRYSAYYRKPTSVGVINNTLCKGNLSYEFKHEINSVNALVSSLSNLYISYLPFKFASIFVELNTFINSTPGCPPRLGLANYKMANLLTLTLQGFLYHKHGKMSEISLYEKEKYWVKPHNLLAVISATSLYSALIHSKIGNSEFALFVGLKAVCEAYIAYKSYHTDKVIEVFCQKDVTNHNLSM